MQFENIPEWEQPIPFDSTFPIESLPHELGAFVEALAESTQTPTEMPAVLSLGVMSTALQGRYTIEVTPDWIEPLCLYTVAIAPPGERKSAVISALTTPLYDYEELRNTQEAEEISISHAERRMLEKSLQEAETKVSKGKGSRDEVRMLAAELSTFELKQPYRLLADDTTPEKLINLMAQQNGSLTV